MTNRLKFPFYLFTENWGIGRLGRDYHIWKFWIKITYSGWKYMDEADVTNWF